MKIGLFAGVFDPIHLGHTDFIKRSINTHGLDRVYVLVEERPKYKVCLASYEDRKKMAEMAIAGIKEARIYISPGESFPITASLPEIKKENPGAKLFLLLGDDVAAHISDWADAQELLAGVELIIAKRDEGGVYSHLSSLKVRKELEVDGTSSGLDPEVLGYCRAKRLYQLIGE